ncbi:hypothetical protein QWW93_05870, partial [Neisseria gonorrhoeae]
YKKCRPKALRTAFLLKGSLQPLYTKAVFLYSPVRGVRNLENSQAMPYIPTQGFILNISLRG